MPLDKLVYVIYYPDFVLDVIRHNISLDGRYIVSFSQYIDMPDSWEGLFARPEGHKIKDKIPGGGKHRDGVRATAL